MTGSYDTEPSLILQLRRALNDHRREHRDDPTAITLHPHTYEDVLLTPPADAWGIEHPNLTGWTFCGIPLREDWSVPEGHLRIDQGPTP